MIQFFKQRQKRKEIKEYTHAARHARNMREDVASAKDLETMNAAEEAVLQIQASGTGDLKKALEALEKATDRIYPFKHRKGIRENVEVVIVALAAAMAIRAFFLQPFKIPTGSMQPTLNGIIATEHSAPPTIFDKGLLKFPKWLITGSSIKSITAHATGQLDHRSLSAYGDFVTFTIGGVEHKIKSALFKAWIPGDNQAQILAAWTREVMKKNTYAPGDTLFTAKVTTGDHILVNKMKYNFIRPQRGDISVFDTKHIDDSRVRADTFYIKRMVGLPGEKIQLNNGELIVNGKPVREPAIFEQMMIDPSYKGHTYAGLLQGPDDFIQLADNEYLMMGDNTENSLDGRFFGGVIEDDFQGPAFFVHWPFSKHWGLIR